MSESKQKIKINELKPDEIYALAAMLVKAGYTVRQTKEKRKNTTRTVYDHYIEFWEGA